MAWFIEILIAAALAFAAPPSPVFQDDFESGVGHWEITGAPFIRTIDSKDPAYGRVLLLEPAGDVYALIRGSEKWGGTRIEFDALFPSAEDNYLGVIYNFQRRDARTDFGLIYIKGNDNYLQANPHRDFSVSRTLYPEYRTPLSGATAIEVGRWQRVKVEVLGSECHFYVGDMTTPRMTFPLFELSSGAIGLQPRSVGGPVWVDNVAVTRINALSYRGSPRPPLGVDASLAGARWQVIGPLQRTHDEVATQPDAATSRWRQFSPDARGAIVTGTIVDYHGQRTVAYFRTRVDSPLPREATLHISTVDDLALWVNGHFYWFIPRGAAAWFDFASNKAHGGQQIPLTLRQGVNDLVFRVRGGVNASGGFFVRVE